MSNRSLRADSPLLGYLCTLSEPNIALPTSNGFAFPRFGAPLAIELFETTPRVNSFALVNLSNSSSFLTTFCYF